MTSFLTGCEFCFRFYSLSVLFESFVLCKNIKMIVQNNENLFLPFLPLISKISSVTLSVICLGTVISGNAHAIRNNFFNNNSELEITAGHHCEGEIFQRICSLFLTGRYFQPCNFICCCEVNLPEVSKIFIRRLWTVEY